MQKLNDEQIAICRQLGVSPEDYANQLLQDMEATALAELDTTSPDEIARMMGVELQSEES